MNILTVGSKHNYWTITGSTLYRGKRKFIPVICSCGVSKTIAVYDLTSGRSKSCGCYHKKVISTQGGISVEDKHLYNAYKNMQQRAKSRNNCNISPLWDNFQTFKLSALNNGYHPSLVLCRNGDTGDYSPDNTRWDTHKNNSIESNAKEWIIITPDNKKITIYNLNEYCRQHNLSNTAMRSIAYYHTSSPHKGYKCFKPNSIQAI